MQAPKDVCLAAADDVTRQRCVRAIQAASAGGGCSSLQDIASSVALSRDLIGMQSLPAVNAVLAALGKAAAKGLDAMKDLGFDAQELKAAGFDLASLKGAGFDLSSLVKAGFDLSSLVKAGFDAASLQGAGFSTGEIIHECKNECCVVG